ncbi:GGDEF domain-containing response regulator [Desulfobacter curvatus]|uniref:GGDEF domain-containing response regulator n=1 Tax=Desulfobacter curvatus TaxID=2290 RepID=UPI0003685214|nr:diguanylate cyclase [Desulfobacter curvatus]
MDNSKDKTILVVDNTKDNLEMVQSILQDYNVIFCTSGADALEMATKEQIDLILLDMLMPERGGDTVCTKLKQNPDTQQIPIISMMAETDEKSIEKTYEQGVADYITKPFKPREVLARVGIQLQLQDVTTKLNFIATRDVLTGIFNRRKFFELGQHLFNASGKQLYVLMIDIDHLKKINDQYGHDVGDIVLKKTANAIKEVLPPDAIFGRMGGEEFSVMYTAQTHELSMDIVSNILKTVSQNRIPLKDGSTVSCTISIGIGQKYPEFNTLDSLLREADMTLYKAKESSENTSIFRNREGLSQNLMA